MGNSSVGGQWIESTEQFSKFILKMPAFGYSEVDLLDTIQELFSIFHIKS